MPDQEYSQAEIAEMLSAPLTPLTAADTPTSDVAPPPQASAPDKLVATAIVPTDAEIEAVTAYYSLLRGQLLQRVADIESFLGFLDVEGDLAVRVGKLERFTGIQGR